MGNLKPFQEQVLIAALHANNFSRNAHNSRETIAKYLPEQIKKNGRRMRKFRKELKRLVAKGYLRIKPTAGDTTYSLTDLALEYANNIGLL